ncbi:right-handed parallel beta-helix repeat-containing protein [Sorangium sp. So ce1014]|uniref:right-handed parallel beta-helix repeat-containing protein n=1 Tax=Sorangium sp. So ce1014 TaxID=3133326 RepID=UPI003F636F07
MKTMKMVSLVVASAIFLPSSALADDGAIPIDAACAAVGCGAGDAPGFPVTLTTPGSYVLSSDLVVPSGQTGVTLIAGSSLDLNGFAIRGPVVCTGEPVTSCSGTLTGVGLNLGSRGRAYGGRIEGFGSHGVSTGADARLYDLIVAQNGGHGVVLSTNASIERSTIVRNLLSGVRGTSGGGDVEVSRSTIRGNGQYGLDISSGLVLQNRVISNGFEGLVSNSGDSNASYALNFFNRNNGSGAEVTGGLAIGCNTMNSTAVCP